MTELLRSDQFSRRAVLAGSGATVAAAASGIILPQPALAAPPGFATTLFYNKGTMPTGDGRAGTNGLFNRLGRALDPALGRGSVATYAVQAVTSGGQPAYLRFEARHGDREPGGRYHREVGLYPGAGNIPADLVGRDGLTRLYAFSVYIPGPESGQSEWFANKYEVIIQQFQPLQGTSPVAFLRIKDNELKSLFRVPSRLGVDPPEGTTIATVSSMKGKWTDIVMLVKWARFDGDGGRYLIWVDGQQKVDHSGRNLFNDTTSNPPTNNGTAGMQFKCGCYASGWEDLNRNGYPDKFGDNAAGIPPARERTRILLIRDVRIGTPN